MLSTLRRAHIDCGGPVFRCRERKTHGTELGGQRHLPGGRGRASVICRRSARGDLSRRPAASSGHPALLQRHSRHRRHPVRTGPAAARDRGERGSRQRARVERCALRRHRSGARGGGARTVESRISPAHLGRRRRRHGNPRFRRPYRIARVDGKGAHDPHRQRRDPSARAWRRRFQRRRGRSRRARRRSRSHRRRGTDLSNRAARLRAAWMPSPAPVRASASSRDGRTPTPPTRSG